MAKIEPANLLLKDKNGNTGLVKSLTNKDITTLKNVVTNVDYIKDFVNANGGSLPVQGDLKLTATDAAGKNGKTLLGTSSGTLQWNGKNIVRSVNGTNADANGNVSITSVANATKASQDKNGAQIDTTYFKSANGTFTGNNYYRDVNNSYLSFSGGTTGVGGAYLVLFGKDSNVSQGGFDLVANSTEDPSNAKQLIGKPDGILLWDNKNIVRSVNSVNADDNGNVSITSVNHATSADSATNATTALKLETYKQGSTTETYGANYPVFAQWKDGTNIALKCTGYTVCVDTATNATNATNLGGYPATKYIRSINSITPDASGNVTIQRGSFMPDYSAGVTLTITDGTTCKGTVPSDGFIFFGMATHNEEGTFHFYINGNAVFYGWTVDGGNDFIFSCPFSKGDTFEMYCTWLGQVTFYPCKGAN